MINKATLLGRLAKDPDVKTFSDGGMLGNLRVITSNRWKDSTGQYKENVQGHNVVIRSPAIAKRLAETLHKGDMVYVEGSMETRKYTDAKGVDRYISEIVVRPYQGSLRRLPLQHHTQTADSEHDHTTPSKSETVLSENTVTEHTEEAKEEIDFFASLGDDDSFSDF